MQPALALRVVRGPDWEWGDQDGGEGHVGTVVGLEEGGGAVVIQWDAVQRCRYRCGEEGKYDLRILDTGPTGVTHSPVRCDSCLKECVYGVMWKCIRCLEYILCSQCYRQGAHSVWHPFMRVDPDYPSRRVKVKPRAKSISQEAWGSFIGALVVRGYDWSWKDQDGGPGNTGKVVAIKDQNRTARSTVDVQWTLGKKNLYRLGHKGKVDVCCTTPTRGGVYYPEHLPTLGASYTEPNEVLLAAGDWVKIELEAEVWKSMQEGHGRWNDLMAESIGSIGVILHILDSGDLLVSYTGMAMFYINPAAVTKMEGPLFKAGDVVTVGDDPGEVGKLQVGHGEWSKDMAQSLGKVGQVIKVLPTGDLRVSVGGRWWIFNPSCLKLAPGEHPQEDITTVYLDQSVREKLQSLMKLNDPQLVPVAAAAGDVSTISTFLQEHPDEVDAKVMNKTGLIVAAAEGYTDVIKTLIELNASVDTEDEDGETALHYCAYLNHVEAAEVLLESKANPNTLNAQGVVPLVICAAFGTDQVLDLLVKDERTELDQQDKDGNTALHVAAVHHRREAVRTLLEAGASPTLANQHYLTPILEAAKNGFYAGMEQFMVKCRQEVNAVKQDDGHSALHIAAANNYLDIVCLLAALNDCELNVQSKVQKRTPLHIAAMQGHARIIEHLIGYGADPNILDSEGWSPLHIIVGQKEIVLSFPEDCPKMKEVKEQVSVQSGGGPVEDYVAVACFLIREGASLESLQTTDFPSDTYSLIASFATLKSSYCGSLQRSTSVLDDRHQLQMTLSLSPSSTVPEN